MKKIISILIIVAISCLSFCGCDSAVEGDEPGTAIINDCTVTIEDNFSTEYCVFNGVPGRMGTIWVEVKNNSNKSVSIGNLANIKVFDDGCEVDFTCYDTYDEVLPGSERTYKYTSGKSVTVSKLLVQIVKGSKVISEKEVYSY